MNIYWLERHRDAIECSKFAQSPRASVAYEQLAAHYLSMHHWVEKRVRVAQLPHSKQLVGELMNSRCGCVHIDPSVIPPSGTTDQTITLG